MKWLLKVIALVQILFLFITCFLAVFLAVFVLIMCFCGHFWVSFLLLFAFFGRSCSGRFLYLLHVPAVFFRTVFLAVFFRHFCIDCVFFLRSLSAPFLLFGMFFFFAYLLIACFAFF